MKQNLYQKYSWLLLLSSIVISSCAVNPVTGKTDFTLVSESEELEIGKESYLPLRQSSGGDYVADKALVEYIDEVGQKIAALSERKLPYEFNVVNSPEINAWALPGGKIAINRGLLLVLENEAELAAVLGHEVVHAAARHGAQGKTRNMTIGLVSAVIVTSAEESDYADKAELIGKTAGILGGLISLKYNRDQERESDHYGMIYMERAGYDTRAAISLQEKFLKLSKSGNNNWIQGLLASHPPSAERVENNTKLAAQLKQGGELGSGRYQKAIAHLKFALPAYTNYQESRKAFKENRMQEAESLVRNAIKIEPDENLFHTLLGDILTRTSKNKEALRSYNTAAKIAPNHYAIYEKRGLLKKAMGDQAGYKEDISEATELLPTAVSYQSLGEIAEKEERFDDAIKLYQVAAGSDSDSGKRALERFNYLDRLYNPENYLKGVVSLDDQQVLVTITNPLDTPVKNISFSLKYGKWYNRKTEENYTYPETIKKDESVALETTIGPISRKSFKKKKYDVIINSAEAVE